MDIIKLRKQLEIDFTSPDQKVASELGIRWTPDEATPEQIKEWHETELSLDSITSGSTNLKFRREGNYDARVLWGQHEEIKIGNYIGFVNNQSNDIKIFSKDNCETFF